METHHVVSTLHVNQQKLQVMTTADSSLLLNSSSKEYHQTILPVPTKPIFILPKPQENFVSQNNIILGPIFPVYYSYGVTSNLIT